MRRYVFMENAPVCQQKILPFRNFFGKNDWFFIQHADKINIFILYAVLMEKVSLLFRIR